MALEQKLKQFDAMLEELKQRIEQNKQFFTKANEILAESRQS